MGVYVKRDNGFQYLGEGTLHSKQSLKLKEGVDANIGMANGIQQAQIKAKELMNKNANVNSASADAGKIDGQQDKNSGEGMTLDVPVDANGTQLASAQRMAQAQNNDDMQIRFVKSNNGQNPSTTQESKTVQRIMELRKNTVPFTKAELKELLSKI